MFVYYFTHAFNGSSFRFDLCSPFVTCEVAATRITNFKCYTNLTLTDTFLRSLFTYIHLCLLINPICHVKRKGENKKKYFRPRLEQKRFSVLNKILLLEQTTCVHTIWHLTGYTFSIHGSILTKYFLLKSFIAYVIDTMDQTTKKGSWRMKILYIILIFPSLFSAQLFVYNCNNGEWQTNAKKTHNRW